MPYCCYYWMVRINCHYHSAIENRLKFLGSMNGNSWSIYGYFSTMRIRLFIFFCLLVSGLYFYSTKSTETRVEREEEKVNTLEEKSKPSEYWEDRWSYPSTESQAENFKQAVATAKKSDAKGNALKSGLSSNWRMEGPTNIGGRANCLLVDAKDNNTIYAGMATGGIFKTTDAGGSWFPIADDFAYLSISQIIQHPKNTDTIFVATGDRNFGSWGRIGDGVKVSYDAGLTWQAAGLNSAGIVSKLLIDSTNNILWASVLGNPRINSIQRGVYMSVDMGQSWQNVHSLNNNVGAIDLVLDPFDSQTLYVSYFNRTRTSTQSIASGNDCRIWQTKNGGGTWSKLTNGLPNYPVSRIGLAVSAQTPGKVYATITDSNFVHEGLYKSLDTGRTWGKEIAMFLPQNYNGGFGWYFGQVRVNPYDDDEVWLLGVDMFTSTNGGNSFTQTVPNWSTYEVHADKHDLVFTGPNTMLLATDGGLYLGTGVITNPNSWVDIDLIPNNQFYRIAINPHRNEFYGGGVQDNGTVSGSSNQADNWTRLFGGDGFQLIYDPVDSNIFYCETQNGNLYAFDQSNAFSNFDFDNGVSGGRNWDMPFIMSRFNRNKLYCLSDRVHQTLNGPSGSFSPVHFGVLPAGISTLSNNFGSALCESKLDSNLLYAGTGDGKVWKIDPSTFSETDISTGLPNRYVTSLTTSSVDSSLVVVSHSGYLDFITTPHLHISTDFGANWTPLVGDLPPFALNDVEILDNTNDSVLFVASDVGVYVTFNRGVNWQRVGGNMPMIPVNDIAIDYSANRLIAGTFARSIQSFDLDSILVQVQQVAFNLGNDTTICKGDSVELGTGLVLDNYAWSTGETTSSIKVFNSGIYWLATQTSNGEVRDSITVTVNDPPSNLFLGNDTTVCEGSSLGLGENIPFFDSYLWNTGETTKIISIQDTGTYILQTQNSCYQLADTIKVSFYKPNLAVIQAIDVNPINTKELVNKSAQYISSRWFLEDELISTADSFRYSFNLPKNYRLILESTDSNLCMTNDTMEFKTEPSKYHIPNIFTPNQDGINDLFLPYGNSVTFYSLVVYNKWGAEIVALENIPWDGRTVGGKVTENGTYFYKAKVKLNTGERINESGTITLLR